MKRRRRARDHLSFSTDLAKRTIRLSALAFCKASEGDDEIKEGVGKPTFPTCEAGLVESFKVS